MAGSNYGYETGSPKDVQAARDRVAIEQMRREQAERRAASGAKPREQLPETIEQPIVSEAEKLAKVMVDRLLSSESMTVERATQQVRAKLKEVSQEMNALAVVKAASPEQSKLNAAKLENATRMQVVYQDQLDILERMAEEGS